MIPIERKKEEERRKKKDRDGAVKQERKKRKEEENRDGGAVKWGVRRRSTVAAQTSMGADLHPPLNHHALLSGN